MIIVETERLTLRNWREDDRNLFREINRDEKVIAFFPYRRSHAECDLLFNYNRNMIAETGLGFYAVADRQTDEAMGYCGLAKADLPGILPDGSVERAGAACRAAHRAPKAPPAATVRGQPQTGPPLSAGPPSGQAHLAWPRAGGWTLP